MSDELGIRQARFDQRAAVNTGMAHRTLQVGNLILIGSVAVIVLVGGPEPVRTRDAKVIALDIDDDRALTANVATAVREPTATHYPRDGYLGTSRDGGG